MIGSRFGDVGNIGRTPLTILCVFSCSRKLWFTAKFDRVFPNNALYVFFVARLDSSMHLTPLFLQTLLSRWCAAYHGFSLLSKKN
ncbi:unnamed protein product [Brassica oleracea]